MVNGMTIQTTTQTSSSVQSSPEASEDAPKVTQTMLDGAKFRVNLEDIPHKTLDEATGEERLKDQ